MVEKTEYTAGPWEVGRYYDVIDRDGTFIGVAIRGSDVERRANARLVASTPDLLAALKEALALLEELFPNPAPFGQIAKARAAIAKTEGR